MSSSLIVACPHCHRKNRVPAERVADGATCGSCKQNLFTGEPLDATQQTIDAHISGDLPVVVDFWAPWCGPCRQFAPTFAATAPQLQTRAQFVKVNTEAEPGLAQRFGIRSIPTLAIFRQGKEIARVSGALPASQFKQWVEQNI